MPGRVRGRLPSNYIARTARGSNGAGAGAGSDGDESPSELDAATGAAAPLPLYEAMNTPLRGKAAMDQPVYGNGPARTDRPLVVGACACL